MADHRAKTKTAGATGASAARTIAGPPVSGARTRTRPCQRRASVQAASQNRAAASASATAHQVAARPGVPAAPKQAAAVAPPAVNIAPDRTSMPSRARSPSSMAATQDASTETPIQATVITGQRPGLTGPGGTTPTAIPASKSDIPALIQALVRRAHRLARSSLNR